MKCCASSTASKKEGGALEKFERTVMKVSGASWRSHYDAGYDAGLNGPNERNCHFSLFDTPEHTKEWERGKAAGDSERTP